LVNHKGVPNDSHENGRDPGPCVHCKEPYSKSTRYVHLVQKKDPKHTVFYEYVKIKYSYVDDDCMRLHNAMKQHKEDAQVRFGTMLTKYNLYAWALTPPTKISV
jgi:hypothetical protein